jgi:hypothetical protein
MTSYEKETILSFKRGAVSLCLATTTGANIVASLEIAGHIAKVAERGKVLFINTVQTERQLASEIRRNIDKDYSAEKPDPRITYLSSPPGLLNSLGKQIRRMLDTGIRFIVINSLEFSTKDSRRKNELLFQIMDWTNIYGAAVLIFGEESETDPITGKIHHGNGGIGKLSVLAKNVFHITSPEDKQEIIDFNKSMSAVHLPDDDDTDFAATDRLISEVAEIDEKTETAMPNWEPANLEEEKALYTAYLKNHPELAFDESVILFNRRQYVMRLIAAEKKKQFIAEMKRSKSQKRSNIIQSNLPDKPPVRSESANENSDNGEEITRARVHLM